MLAIGGTVETIADIVQLKSIDADRFVSLHTGANEHWLYGGQILAQALMASCNTLTDDRVPHSLHAYFLAAGKSTEPVELHVTRDRDGGSYSARTIDVVQNDQLLMRMMASFQVPEVGFEAQAASFPDVARPSAESDLYDHPVSPDAQFWDVEPDPSLVHPTRLWCRFQSSLPDDPRLQACALAYLSDISNGLVSFPGFPADARVSSLDHSLWFYRPINMSQWHLMDWIGHSISGGRGHYTGHFYDTDGVMVAGAAQEDLVRLRTR